jgi:hypothetical protein
MLYKVRWVPQSGPGKTYLDKRQTGLFPFRLFSEGEVMGIGAV